VDECKPLVTGGDLFVATLTRLSADGAHGADGGGGGAEGGAGARTLSASSAAQVAAAVTDNGDGTYQARFAAPAEGMYALDVALQEAASGALAAVGGLPVLRPAVFDATSGAWSAVVPSPPSAAAPAPRRAPLAAWARGGSVFVLGGEGAGQGLTLVHYSAQPEPFPTQKKPQAPHNTP